MKIRDLKVAVVRVPDFGRFGIVRIDTDEDVYGYGEAHCPREHVMRLKNYLVGQDPTNVGKVMSYIQYMGGFKPWGSAVSAIEMALWDIAGKAFGLPVYRFLGGKMREKVRVYCDCGVGVQLDPSDPASVYTPEAYAEKAKRMKSLPEGFTILKFDIGFHGKQLLSVRGGSLEAEPTYPTKGHVTERGLKSEIAIVDALKDSLGDEVSLALDCGPGQSFPSALRLARALEPYNLMWAEDLLTGDYSPYTEVYLYALLSRRTTTPILTGEQIFLRYGFRDLVAKHAVDIVAPDVSDVGGIYELKWIAEFADLYGVLIAPHNYGLPIAFVANVHAAAAMPKNFIAFEHHAAHVSQWEDFVKGLEKPLIKDGFVNVPEKPGLGIEINEDLVKKYLVEGEDFFEY
ncbi:MAG: mandelate racemase/muconate lactonizing enzyme family protein [Candidatus Bathyarchaeota archaeon]|nr:mandelate racemase/muconate lactonizing enzyme family protein [Candidatus Bathyarchaeota archaeon]